MNRLGYFRILLRICIIIILLVIMSIIMTSCKSTEYIPIETIKKEYAEKLVRDSIYLKDSIYIREKGDTVFIDRWQTKYIQKLRVDSFLKIDTIPVSYPVEVKIEVEKKLSWWQKTKMDIGGIAIGGLIIFILCFCFKLYKKIKG